MQNVEPVKGIEVNYPIVKMRLLQKSDGTVYFEIRDVDTKLFQHIFVSYRELVKVNDFLTDIIKVHEKRLWEAKQ